MIQESCQERQMLPRAIKQSKLGTSGDLKPTCLDTYSLETTWKPYNLTRKTKIVNGVMPLS